MSVAGTRLVVVGGLALVACGVEAFINRQATLTGRIVASDGQAGVPCTVTALLFGDEEAHTPGVTGSDFTLNIGMVTPAKVESPVKAKVAVRLACQGYATVTTPEHETEVAVDAPRVDFGSVTTERRPR